MKIRGSLTISKKLKLLNPGGLMPEVGLVALSDTSGNIVWGRFSIPEMNTTVSYPDKGTLLNHEGKTYFSLIENASAAQYLDNTLWKELGASNLEQIFTRDVIAALNGASNPSAGNTFATTNQVNNLTIKGTDTSSNILARSAAVVNNMWISSVDGIDSYGQTVLEGDGLISDGIGWKNIGQIRGSGNGSSNTVFKTINGESIVGEGNITTVPAVFTSINEGIFVTDSNRSDYGETGATSFDFTFSIKGAEGDPASQVGQIGVEVNELYGATGSCSIATGYNTSVKSFGSVVSGSCVVSGTYAHFSHIAGRNNSGDSYCGNISGSFNIDSYTYLGHKTIFGNGNVVTGAGGLTSGVALINKSFATTVIGQANLDYSDTSESVNNGSAPLFIVGNGSVTVPTTKWNAITRRNALELYFDGTMTLPSITNELIALEATGKVLITREFLDAYLQDKIEQEVTRQLQTP